MPPIYNKKKNNAMINEAPPRISLKPKKSGFLNTIKIDRNGSLIPERRDTKTPETPGGELKKSRLMIANDVAGNIELF